MHLVGAKVPPLSGGSVGCGPNIGGSVFGGTGESGIAVGNTVVGCNEGSEEGKEDTEGWLEGAADLDGAALVVGEADTDGEELGWLDVVGNPEGTCDGERDGDAERVGGLVIVGTRVGGTEVVGVTVWTMVGNDDGISVGVLVAGAEDDGIIVG
mmetsp:Transcript_343/g.690  ORF Transcript_343/g.690 Transcript_343/m.690 type:complete len:154 (-) Transcript_343:1432-1893(-)